MATIHRTAMTTDTSLNLILAVLPEFLIEPVRQYNTIDHVRCGTIDHRPESSDRSYLLDPVLCLVKDTILLGNTLTFNKGFPILPR